MLWKGLAALDVIGTGPSGQDQVTDRAPLGMVIDGAGLAGQH